MNHLEFGFFDELEKIAAYEMRGVRPEVSKQLAAQVREKYLSAPRSLRELPRDLAHPSRVSFRNGEHEDPETWDLKTPGHSFMVGERRKAIAEARKHILHDLISDTAARGNAENPDFHKTTHIPGYGRAGAKYLATLPRGWPNPWGPKINVPTQSMPTPPNQ